MSDNPDLGGDANEVTLWDRLETSVASLELQLDRRLLAAEGRCTERLNAQAMAIAIAKSASENAITVAMTASAKATRREETASEKRIVSMSESLASFGEVVARQMPRDEAQAQINALSERLESVARGIAPGKESGHGLNSGWLILVGLVGAVVAATGIVVAT